MKTLRALAIATVLFLGLLITSIEAYQTAPGAMQITFKNGFNVVVDEGKINTFKEDKVNVKDVKRSIENMIQNGDSMQVIKEGRVNNASIEGDKVIIAQDIANSNYIITLDKNHENIIDSVLMYMTGYNAFNKSLKGIDITFNTEQQFEIVDTFVNDSGSTIIDFSDGSSVVVNHEQGLYEFTVAELGDWEIKVNNINELNQVISTYMNNKYNIETGITINNENWLQDDTNENSHLDGDVIIESEGKMITLDREVYNEVEHGENSDLEGDIYLEMEDIKILN